MEEQRVEAHRVGLRFRHCLGRREGDTVGRPLDEGVEGVAQVERRTQHVVPRIRFQRRRVAQRGAVRARRRQRAGAERGLSGPRRLPRQRLVDLGHAASPPGGAAHDDFDLEDVGLLGLPKLVDQIEIVSVDPRPQECRRDRKPGHPLGQLGELHAAEPAGIDLAAEPGLELRLDAFERPVLAPRHRRHALSLDNIHWKGKACPCLPFDCALHFPSPSFFCRRRVPHRLRFGSLPRQQDDSCSGSRRPPTLPSGHVWLFPGLTLSLQPGNAHVPPAPAPLPDRFRTRIQISASLVSSGHDLAIRGIASAWCRTAFWLGRQAFGPSLSIC